MIDSKQRLLIWDSDSDCLGFEGVIVLWNGLQEKHNVISLSSYVESDAEYFRKKYLSWVFEFGEMYIDNRKIIDLFLLPNGLSYWWMTSIAQKFNISGTSPINNAIKILAIEKLIVEKKTKEIVLFTENLSLSLTVKQLCEETGINFMHTNLKNNVYILQNSIFRNYIQAIIYWIWYFKNALFYLGRKKRTNSLLSNSDFCFIDILVYLDKQNLKTGIFGSNYWRSLVSLLTLSSYKTTWVHNFYAHKEIPNLRKANEVLNIFNDSDKSQIHILIESYLTIPVLFKSLKTYFTLVYKSRFFRKKKQQLPYRQSLLFTLLSDEFYESISGRNAMKNCIRLELTNSFFSHIPKQNTGFFIQENQAWELAVLHAWKKNGHGTIIGIPHTTVRFWDLRYFFDERTYQVKNLQTSLPLPDKIALNSPFAKKEYLKAGYPESCIEEVEALRYLHLAESRTCRPKKEGKFTLLICGDFLLSTTNMLLKCVEEAIIRIDIVPNIIVKPHPSRPINPADYPNLVFSISEKPINFLFAECDVVFTSNITSAAVDAYCSRIQLIQLLEGQYFNMSPLREVVGIRYVRDGKELANCLINRDQILLPNNPYFFLNTDLPRWKKLLRCNSKLKYLDSTNTHRYT